MKRLIALAALAAAGCGRLPEIYDCETWCGSDFAGKKILVVAVSEEASANMACFKTFGDLCSAGQCGCPAGELRKCACK